MKITGYTVEQLEDPTGILQGERYEYLLEVEVPEDDELHTENGLLIKAIYVVDERGARIAQYYLMEQSTEKYLDFELEEEEEELITTYIAKHHDEEESESVQ
ncbi:pullulanase [Rossellomorea vietnamensis]|uniref:Pullulanase n=1 Tax=Rossellomorea vietnamensis TaxID=218284 RepID=A0A5D4MCD1_9BACI|nr:DUF6509 family protein [Rossellomorea vietnamensis]TYR99332.1 pullulanase [Rossellomorea vietnamensis]